MCRSVGARDSCGIRVTMIAGKIWRSFKWRIKRLWFIDSRISIWNFVSSMNSMIKLCHNNSRRLKKEKHKKNNLNQCVAHMPKFMCFFFFSLLHTLPFTPTFLLSFWMHRFMTLWITSIRIHLFNSAQKPNEVSHSSASQRARAENVKKMLNVMNWMHFQIWHKQKWKWA